MPQPGDSRVVWQDVSATSSVSALKDDVFQKKASRRQQQADLWDEVFISYLAIYLSVFFIFFFFAACSHGSVFRAVITSRPRRDWQHQGEWSLLALRA